MSRWRGLREDQRVGEGLVEMLLATLRVPLNLCRSQLVGEAGAAIRPQDVSRTSSLPDASLRSAGTTAQTGGWVWIIDGRWLTS